VKLLLQVVAFLLENLKAAGLLFVRLVYNEFRLVDSRS
jgi:hypothetical protein